MLLSVKPNAATAVALVAAAGIMAVAAFVASRKQRDRGGARVRSSGAAAGIAMLAGGIAIAVIGPPEEEVRAVPRDARSARREPIESGFSTDALTFEADVPIELEFDNEDPGVGHNVQIFDGPDDSAPSLFDGAAITGPDAIPYAIAPLAPGEYFFHCRLHPGTAMQGTITVQKGAGGVEVVAKDTAFDTDEIELPADTPSTLTLDNEDPFAHNLSIYEDDSASGEPLFTFEPFAGPASKTVRRAIRSRRASTTSTATSTRHERNGRGGAGSAARRGRECSARRRGSGREPERFARRGRLSAAGSVAARATPGRSSHPALRAPRGAGPRARAMTRCSASRSRIAPLAAARRRDRSTATTWTRRLRRRRACW